MCRSQLSGYFKKFLVLSKFRLSVSNSFVALTPFVYYHPFLDFQTLCFGTGTLLMAMSTQIANQIKEKEYDLLMKRTCQRPLPQNIFTKKQGCVLASSLFGTANLIFLFNFPVQSIILLNTIFFSYVFVYTPLKRINHINTFVGALIGALPPLIGAAACSQSIFSLFPFSISCLIFGWQFPHFYGILFSNKEDYKKAGFKMQFSKEKTHNMLYMATFIQSISFLGIFSQMHINIFFLPEISFFIYFYQKGVIKVLDFIKETENSERNLLIGSFQYIGVLYLLFIMELLFRISQEFQKEKTEIKQKELNQLYFRNIFSFIDFTIPILFFSASK